MVPECFLTDLSTGLVTVVVVPARSLETIDLFSALLAPPVIGRGRALRIYLSST